MNAITEAVARNVLSVVDAGLVMGMGQPEPGKMCVEAAVCFALGLPHSDNPPCVHEAVRAFKIRLNDANWPSDQARTKGMRRIAIAQLGSTHIDARAFADAVAVGTVNRILPIALRAAGQRNPTYTEALEAAAVKCEAVTTTADARDAARNAAAAAADAAYAAAAAARYAAADAADAYADAADAAADADATAAARVEILTLSADIATDALIACGSEGAAFLYLCDTGAA